MTELAVFGSVPGGLGGLPFEGARVDDIAEADFTVLDVFVGVVDVPKVEELDVGGGVVLGAEVEDFLGSAMGPITGGR